MDRITTLVAKGQDQTDNAALLPYKLVKLEDYEGGNEGESMKKRHWRQFIHKEEGSGRKKNNKINAKETVCFFINLI